MLTLEKTGEEEKKKETLGGEISFPVIWLCMYLMCSDIVYSAQETNAMFLSSKSLGILKWSTFENVLFNLLFVPLMMINRGCFLTERRRCYCVLLTCNEEEEIKPQSNYLLN